MEKSKAKYECKRKSEAEKIKRMRERLPKTNFVAKKPKLREGGPFGFDTTNSAWSASLLCIAYGAICVFREKRNANTSLQYLLKTIFNN